MRSFLVATLFLIGHITVFAQTKNDTLIAWQHYKKADSLLEVKNHNESILLFKKALPIYETAKAWGRVASCYNKISETKGRMRELEELFLNAKNALNISHLHLSKDHVEEANAFDNIGRYYQEKGEYNKVLSFYQKALIIRKKRFPPVHLEIVKSYQSIGLFYYYTEKFRDAIKYYDKSLAIYQEIFDSNHVKVGDINNNLGVMYKCLQKFDKALKYYEKHLSITIKNRGEDHLYAGYGYLNIGNIYIELNQPNLALKYCKKALFIFKKEENYFLLSSAYNNIGNIYANNNELNKSLEYFKKSLELWKKIYGKDHPTVAGVYGNIGTTYSKLDKEKSLIYLTKALHIYIKAFGKNHSEVSNIYNNMGNLYADKKEYDLALNYYHKSLGIEHLILDKNHSDIANSHKNIGVIYEKKEAYTKAIQSYQKSLAVLKEKSKQHFKLVSISYNNIGRIYSKQKKYTEALSYFDKSIQVNTKNISKTTHKKKFDPNHYSDLHQLFTTLIEKSRTLQKYYEKDKNIQYLEQSIALYNNLDQLMNFFKRSYQNYSDKVTLAEQAKEMYADAITAQLLLFESNNDQRTFEKALYYSEKSKSNILKDLLLDNNAKKFAGLSHEITVLESTLKSKRAFYQSRILAEKSRDSIDVTSIQEYESKLFGVVRRQDSLTQILEEEHPKYYKIRHQNKVVTVSEIQKKLDKKTTLLEFFTSDSTTYAFIISKNNFAIKKIQATELEKNIRTIHEAITSKDNNTYASLAYKLYNEIMAPIEKQLVGNEIIIIPDGVLWHLNFELLLTEQNTQLNVKTKELPYLLRDYAISYANSATLLFSPFKQKLQTEKQDGCLAFSFSDSANVVTSKNISLATLRNTGDDLPGTRKEIKAIADIMDGQYYFGTDADEATFKKNANRYKILHLALHGEVDNKHPENSKLFFTKSKDTIEDNLLYGHELFALDIPTELTVLSACNTGAGKIAKGEGIMSLGNAFQYAGTKSLLLSSWEISDRTTPALMKYFYTNLKKGMRKSKALQRAKLQYLANADFHTATPFYWGSFYLVGDPTPIDFGINILWYWIFGAIVLLTIVFLGYKRFKRN
ncbi:CHAT domain-containing protein [Aquimarina pacifica]|uniref:CHAT domain-containing protein n=1 Tax=Aquimarina pacifica TaxID=1296415 RepID=UPI0004724A8E|nr:CHAT domain-containing tetratricopeptide repeat protein [Aquimarina pacifica]